MRLAAQIRKAQVSARLLAAAVVVLHLTMGSTTSHAQALDPTKPLTQFSLDSWTDEDELPQRSVIAIAQTPDGFLWLGTYAGLVRFDGLRFVTFAASGPGGLPSSTVHALAVDPAGPLWIGTSSGLCRLERGVFTTLTTENGLVGDFVRAVHVDHRGRVWIGTNDGLSRLERGQIRSWTTANGLPNGIIRALAEDAQGRVYAGTNGGGIVRFEDDNITVLSTRDGLPSDSIFAMIATRDGSLWIGTNGDGLARLRRGVVDSFGLAQGLPHRVVWSLHEDQSGTVWAGTYGGGVSRFEDGRFTSLDRRQGLPDDYVRALASDREGSLWIGTYAGGLARLRDGKFVVYGVREGLGADFARAVLEASNGSLWIGTTGGGLCERTPSGIRCWDRKNGLADDVRALYEDGQGGLWVGTSGEGLFLRKGEGFERVPFPPEIPAPSITAIAPDGRGGLWIGTNGAGLVHRSSEADWQLYRKADGLGSDFVLCVLVARDGAVWAGTDGGGLSALRDGRLETRRRRDGMTGDVVFALHEDDGGAIWAGTSGGLTRVKGDSLTRFTTGEGLAEDVVFGIVDDGRGYLWLSGNRGLTRIERSSLQGVVDGTRKRVEVTTLGRADGMRTSECSGVAQPAAFRARDGRLFFPTTGGVVGIDPSRIHPSDLVPPVVVEEVLADGERVTRLSVPPGRRRWEFRYTAPTFVAAQRVRFRYKLEGFDAAWVEAGTERSAHYTRLPPGTYTFRVTAANADGVWNEKGASVTLTLEPHLWETRFFWSALALTLVSLAASIWVLRVRGLRRRQRELVALVDSRTRELVAEKELSEDARADAEAQRELAQLATRHKGELLSIAAHDLKTPLQVVVGYCEMIATDDSLEKAREYAARSVNAARRMIEIIERLLASEALAEGRIPLQAERIDVSQVARESAAALGSRASAKLQRVELDSPAVALVHADPRLLRQILDNLLDNAIKYSPQAGTIRIVVRADGDHVRVEIRDEGPGLSSEDYAHLFERFQRLSAQPTGGESSTGLGLSIVKQLVGLHGGRVWAESEGLGRGTTFIVELDEKGAEAEPDDQPQEITGPHS